MLKKFKNMKLDKKNIIIYSVGLAISIILIALYFLSPNSPWCIVLCSIGASGLGAVVLGFLIEWANNTTNKSQRDLIRATKLEQITIMANNLLRKVVKNYFHKRIEVCNDLDKVSCYKISYSSLWCELKKLEHSLKEQYLENTAKKKQIKSINDDLLSACVMLSEVISYKKEELVIFQATGCFNDNDSNILTSVRCSSTKVAQSKKESFLNYEELHNIFEFLVMLPEFVDFSSRKYYFKENQIDYESNIHKLGKSYIKLEPGETVVDHG